ncbi:MAG: RnfABCDGE type electron transport complex subunit D [Treponema sp.]|nr:RnfABCDGE type electron transport complex subunit D [Treponema sp.]
MNLKKAADYKIKSKQLAISPFIYSTPSISAASIKLLVLLSLQALMLIFAGSYKSFIVVVSAVMGACAAAALSYLFYKKEHYQIMNLAIQGLMIGLLIPADYPPVPVFFITLFTLFFSRFLIFKSVNSWLNMTAFVVLVCWIIGRNYFPSFLLTSDLIPLRNSSVYLIQNGSFPIYSFDSTITSFLNSTVFALFKVSIPEGFVSLLWDSGNAIPAFRFTILTIISSILIFSDNTASGLIPVIFLLVYALLVRFFSPMIFGGMFNQGDIILALSSSGILFCTVFLIQWYGTIPVTRVGRVVLAFCLGITAFLIVGCGTSPIGMMYTILINNIITLFIRSFEEKKNQKNISKVVAKHPFKSETGVQA